MFFNDGDDNWNSTANLCVYEKQPLIGAVHELIVEFRDDILTIFPLRLREWTCGRGRVVWLVSLVLSWYRRQELSRQPVRSIIRAGAHNIHAALDIYVTYNGQKKAEKWFKEHSGCSVPKGTLHPECSSNHFFAFFRHSVEPRKPRP